MRKKLLAIMMAAAVCLPMEFALPGNFLPDQVAVAAGADVCFFKQMVC